MLTFVAVRLFPHKSPLVNSYLPDEFKGASGSPVDPTKRTMQTGRKVGPKPRPQRALAWTSPKYRISCVAGFPAFQRIVYSQC